MEWWKFLLVMALVLPVLVLWLGCIIDAISRPDIGGLSKAAWVLFILLLPIIGSLVYIIVRPRTIVAPASETDQVRGSTPDSLPTTAERGSNLSL